MTRPSRVGPASNAGGLAPSAWPRLHRPFTARPSTAPLVRRTGRVVGLHRRDVVAVGSLAGRGHAYGDRMVSAHDLDGTQWWLPAAAVWTDADTGTRPDHPCAIGLATASDPTSAITAGLSDRLGWEAVVQFEHTLLPSAPIDAPERLIVLDGRLDHDVPTVITLGDDIVRWGAGATWKLALQRAMFGHDTATASDDDDELTQLAATLTGNGLHVATVDLATPLLTQAGIHRTSVQLMLARNGTPVGRDHS